MNIFKTAYKTGEKLGEKLGGKLKERLENGSKAEAEPKTDLYKRLEAIDEMSFSEAVDRDTLLPVIKELIDKAPKRPEGYYSGNPLHSFFSVQVEYSEDLFNIQKALLDKGYDTSWDMFYQINRKYSEDASWDELKYGGAVGRDSSYLGEMINLAEKTNSSEVIGGSFPAYIDSLKEKGDHLKGASKDSILEELQKMTPDTVPELDPKYISSEQGQEFNKQLGIFMNRLRQRSGDTLDGSPSPLGKESLRVLEEFAKKGYPSAQEQMAMIADSKNDKKALNHWAKQVEKNPFSSEKQKEMARDDIKDTQAFVAQTQARGGR